MRAFYRSYVAGGKRSSRVTRLHLMREDGTFPGRQGMCGIHGWDVTRSDTVIIDPAPDVPPHGLSWCTKCVDVAQMAVAG